MRLKWAPVDLEWNSGMWNSGQIQSILDGAQDPQQSAVGRLDQGDTRDAAEKAWGATRRATGALILARTVEFPETTAGTTRMLMDLAGTSAGLETLAGRCFTRISYPHGSCFHEGLCGPDTDRQIIQTFDCIQDARALANSP